MSMVEFICEICGNKYQGHHSRTGQTHTCGRKCASERLRLNIDDNEIKHLYLGGMSTIEIGKKMGVSWATIANRLRKTGIPLRKRTAHLLTDKNPTKGKGHTEQTRKKMSAKSSAYFSNPKAREMAAHNQCLYLAKKLVANVSGVEHRIAKELDKRGVKYDRQVAIRNLKTGRYGACVDFMINGVVIEVNGTYWHSDIRVYPDGPKSKSQERTASNYKKKMELLKSLGMKVVEAWEMDIDKDVSAVVDKIIIETGANNGRKD